jgi:hypothetical protein
MQYGIVFKIEKKDKYQNKYIVEKVVEGYWNTLDAADDVLSTTKTIQGVAFAHRADGVEYEKDTYILDTNIIYAKCDVDNPENNHIEHENLFYDYKYLPNKVKAEVGKELEILTHTWD